MNQSTAQSQFLLHTTRQFPRTPFSKWFYLSVNRSDQIIIIFHAYPEQGCEKFKIFLDRQIGIKRKTPRHISHPFADFFILPDNIESIYRRHSIVGIQQRRKQAEKRSLAGSIGTYQTEQLPPPHLERYIFDCRERTVPLGQSSYFYGIPYSHLSICFKLLLMKTHLSVKAYF